MGKYHHADLVVAYMMEELALGELRPGLKRIECVQVRPVHAKQKRAQRGNPYGENRTEDAEHHGIG